MPACAPAHACCTREGLQRQRTWIDQKQPEENVVPEAIDGGHQARHVLCGSLAPYPQQVLRHDRHKQHHAHQQRPPRVDQQLVACTPTSAARAQSHTLASHIHSQAAAEASSAMARREWLQRRPLTEGYAGPEAGRARHCEEVELEDGCELEETRDGRGPFDLQHQKRAQNLPPDSPVEYATISPPPQPSRVCSA